MRLYQASANNPIGQHPRCCISHLLSSNQSNKGDAPIAFWLSLKTTQRDQQKNCRKDRHSSQTQEANNIDLSLVPRGYLFGKESWKKHPLQYCCLPIRIPQARISDWLVNRRGLIWQKS
ncbi:hypothetical protein [Stenotrophomonas sp. GZD-301]|uniref:hypothetical protein n=1 Tax=Stenotrophomonas sp. GZD-301 TaxID=3404814 RepID=UPI003BB7E0CF